MRRPGDQSCGHARWERCSYVRASALRRRSGGARGARHAEAAGTRLTSVSKKSFDRASALARWPGASAPSSSLHKKCLKGEAASDSGAEGHLRSTLRDLCCGRKQTAPQNKISLSPQVMGGGGGGGDACCCCISSRLLRLRSSLSAARRLRAFSLSSRSLSFRLLSLVAVSESEAPLRSSRGRPSFGPRACLRRGRPGDRSCASMGWKGTQKKN